MVFEMTETYNPLENINPKSRLANNNIIFLKDVTVGLMKSEKYGNMVLSILPKNANEVKSLNAFMEMAVNLGLEVMAINTETHTQTVLSLKDNKLNFDIP